MPIMTELGNRPCFPGTGPCRSLPTKRRGEGHGDRERFSMGGVGIRITVDGVDEGLERKRAPMSVVEQDERYWYGEGWRKLRRNLVRLCLQESGDLLYVLCWQAARSEEVDQAVRVFVDRLLGEIQQRLRSAPDADIWRHSLRLLALPWPPRRGVDPAEIPLCRRRSRPRPPGHARRHFEGPFRNHAAGGCRPSTARIASRSGSRSIGLAESFAGSTTNLRWCARQSTCLRSFARSRLAIQTAGTCLDRSERSKPISWSSAVSISRKHWMPGWNRHWPMIGP